MAVWHKKMNIQERSWLCRAMVNSGDQCDFKDIPEFIVDKHSSGGIGDKTSLIIAPLIAEIGLKVPMVSGRGLGHTGGTLDKLEAIPGFNFAVTFD
jgi:thymidine phosphorylase